MPPLLLFLLFCCSPPLLLLLTGGVDACVDRSAAPCLLPVCRYGYGFSTKDPMAGYDFVTMGGGLCLSKPLMQRLIDDPGTQCSAPDTPDDMQVRVYVC